MEANNDKIFDTLIKKTIKENGLESPSVDFTDTVLAKISELPQYEGAKYRPLISKYTWYTLAAAILVVFVFLQFGNLNIEANWLTNLKFDFELAAGFFDKIPSLSIPNAFVYGFVILAFFMGVQVVLLKKHFDKQFA